MYKGINIFFVIQEYHNKLPAKFGNMPLFSDLLLNMAHIEEGGATILLKIKMCTLAALRRSIRTLFELVAQQKYCLDRPTTPPLKTPYNARLR